MKRFFFIFLSSALLFSGTAFADILSVTADVPVSFTPSEDGGTVNSISGYTAGLALVVFPVGIGVEQYTVNYDSTSSKGFETKFSIVDIYFNLPIPIINIAIGAGAGTATTADVTTGSDTLKTEDAKVVSTFASLGYSILPMIDLHFGLHMLNTGSVNSSVNGTNVSTLNMGGSVMTAGIKVGF